MAKKKKDEENEDLRGTVLLVFGVLLKRLPTFWIVVFTLILVLAAFVQMTGLNGEFWLNYAELQNAVDDCVCPPSS